MANNDFLLNVLERFNQNFNFTKNSKSKVCSQDFLTNDIEVVFLSDIPIFE